MKVLGLLQNMWFKDPERAKKTLAFYYEKKGDGGRERFISDMLFFGCLTGRRLRQAFGEERCDEIIWEEVSSWRSARVHAKPCVVRWWSENRFA